MILPDFILPEWKNQNLKEVAIDSLEHCFDKNHFESYPYVVDYHYNSRGFRDSEWPAIEQELKDAIWCFGDSCVTGVGAPLAHTWVNILQESTGRRCINVSMAGASNEWIARRAIKVIEIIKPVDVVIHWSYLWRGEDPNTNLSDDERMIRIQFVDDVEMANNFSNLINQVDAVATQTNVIYSVIPGFSTLNYKSAIDTWNTFKGSNWPEFPKSLGDYKQLSPILLKELKNLDLDTKFKGFFVLANILTERIKKSNWIEEFEILDFARDGYHYDKQTANCFVSEILKYI